MVYGKHKGLGEYLYERVVNRKEGSRSTQSVDIAKLIKELEFEIVVPPDKNVDYVYNLIIDYNKKLESFINKDKIRQL